MTVLSYLDYQHKQFAVFRKGDGELFPGIPNVGHEEYRFEQSDALLDEIKAFIHCIQTKTSPLVTGEDGREALATAAKISELVDANLKIHQTSADLEELA